MKSSKYWAKRAEKRMDYAMLEAQEISNRIGAAYVGALRDIQAQLDRIFVNFAAGVSEAEAKRILQRAALDPDHDFMDGLRQAIALVKDPDEKAELLAELNAPAYKARMQRLKALAEDVGKKCEELARTSDRALDGGLSRIVRDSYYRGVFDVQHGTGLAFSFSKVSERMIKEILQQNWSGKHYSKRIWGNTNELAEQLRQTLMKGVLTGASSGRMANEIQERFHASYSRALTLTRTESSHCANSAEMYRYKDTGVEKYRYVATLDNRTSEICQELDGKVFPVKDAKPGTNYPPMHPRCRSTTIEELSPALMKKLERRARDPVTGELMTVPGDMTYKEWYAKYVDGGELTGGTESGIIKNIELPPETNEVRSMSDETKEQISNAIDLIQSEYNVEIDEFITEALPKKFKNVPFQFSPVRGKDGELVKRLVINSEYDFMGTQEGFQNRIMRNFRNGTLASNSVIGLISHELAHIMTFQDVSTYSGYLLELKRVEEDFVSGISRYADGSADGAECIAEAFAAKMCGLPISSEAQNLLDKYIEKRRKV